MKFKKKKKKKKKKIFFLTQKKKKEKKKNSNMSGHSCPVAPPTYDNVRPPKGYNPGVGRGAIGFSTRGDVGPAAAVPSSSAGGPRGIMGAGTTGYDHNDAEADATYSAVEQEIERRRKKLAAKRRKRKRDAPAASSLAKTTQDIPKLFADTKEKLGQISESEWAAIPEVGDHTLQYKEKKEDIYTPVPENILETARLSEAVSGVVSETNSLFDDVHRLSGARGQMLQHKFDHISRSGGL